PHRSQRTARSILSLNPANSLSSNRLASNRKFSTRLISTNVSLPRPPWWDATFISELRLNSTRSKTRLPSLASRELNQGLLNRQHEFDTFFTAEHRALDFVTRRVFLQDASDQFAF